MLPPVTYCHRLLIVTMEPRIIPLKVTKLLASLTENDPAENTPEDDPQEISHISVLGPIQSQLSNSLLQQSFFCDPLVSQRTPAVRQTTNTILTGTSQNTSSKSTKYDLRSSPFQATLSSVFLWTARSSINNPLVEMTLPHMQIFAGAPYSVS